MRVMKTLYCLILYCILSPDCRANQIPFLAFSKPDGGGWPQSLTPRSTHGWIQDFHSRGADDGQLKRLIVNLPFGDEMEADLGFFGGRRLIYDGPGPFLPFSRSAYGLWISEEGKENNTLISGTNATIGWISEEGKEKNKLNSSTNSTHGWILEEGKKKNNLVLGNDGFEESGKDGVYTTPSRSKKTSEKLRTRIPSKKASGDLIKLIFMLVILLCNVSVECSPHENHKGNEQCYGHKLIYESQSKVNNSESYEDHTRTDVEHRSTTTHVKNGENDVKLRFLVPSKNTFSEFVKVDHDPEGNRIIITGYAIDVFKEVMNSLAKNVSFEFFICENGSYDELIQLLHVNGCDGVVGDITITFNRSKYGEFTQPYMMAGVSMIVPVVGSRKSWWWFLRPCTAGLWGLMLGLFLSKMLMVLFFEHCENNPVLEGGTFLKQVWEALFLSFSVFATSQNEKLKSKCSILVKSIWIIELVLLMAFYYPALQPLVSSYNGGPIVTGLEKLIMNGDYVGYQKGSFVLGLLKDMGFQEQKLKAYSSIEEYATALSRGSRNNGVSAIIDEIPYIKLFLAKHDDRYTMAGPSFRPESGFSFLFKRGSTITRDVSDGVVKFKEGEMMSKLEKKWFGSYEPNPSSTQMPQQLSLPDFYGVIVITIPITLLAFFGFIVSKCRKTNLNRSDVQMTGIIVNGVPHTGTVGSDQTRPTDDSPEVEDTQIDLGNTGIASGENVYQTRPIARSSAVDVDAQPLSPEIREVDVDTLPLSPEIQVVDVDTPLSPEIQEG
ncbi:hypothetical protein AAC387_Pa04g0659 [Persea americana]